MRRLLQTVPVCLAALLLLGSAPSVFAFEEEGVFEGNYDVDDQNDWFYDSYEESTELGDDDWFGADLWTEEEYYSGYYDNDLGTDDWYYDTYDDPGDGGLFDV